MKAGMKTILTHDLGNNEAIVLCGDGNEYATYTRYNNDDYYGRYYFDQLKALEGFVARIKEALN